MVPILINKDVFEPSYNDLKSTVWNCNYICTNILLLAVRTEKSKMHYLFLGSTWISILVYIRGSFHGIAEAWWHAPSRPLPFKDLRRYCIQACGSSIENINNSFFIFTPIWSSNCNIWGGKGRWESKEAGKGCGEGEEKMRVGGRRKQMEKISHSTHHYFCGENPNIFRIHVLIPR